MKFCGLAYLKCLLQTILLDHTINNIILKVTDVLMPVTNLFPFSTLSMFVEPDGPGYEIDILCDVAPAKPKSAAGTLLSDKHILVFGGVALGTSL